MEEYRQAITDAIERLEWMVDRMEIWGARPEETLKVIYKKIEKCDIFVGIYAHRYGTIHPDQEVPPGEKAKSITELEYDKAMEKDKSCFCFLIKEDYPWNPQMIQGKRQLQKFKRKIKDDLIIEEFTSFEDLAVKVGTSIRNYLEKPEEKRELEKGKKGQPASLYELIQSDPNLKTCFLNYLEQLKGTYGRFILSIPLEKVSEVAINKEYTLLGKLFMLPRMEDRTEIRLGEKEREKEQKYLAVENSLTNLWKEDKKFRLILTITIKDARSFPGEISREISQIMIEGRPGVRKSSILRRLLVLFCNEISLLNIERINFPVFIELRKFERKFTNRTLLKYLKLTFPNFMEQYGKDLAKLLIPHFSFLFSPHFSFLPVLSLLFSLYLSCTRAIFRYSFLFCLFFSFLPLSSFPFFISTFSYLVVDSFHQKLSFCLEVFKVLPHYR